MATVAPRAAPVSGPELESLLRLALIPGIGPGRLTALMDHLGTADRVLGASPATLSRVPGLGREMIRRLHEANSPAARERAHAAMRGMERVGAVALTLHDQAYPEGFRVLVDPPFLVFAAGRLELLHRSGIAVVGTRQPSAYGQNAAAALATDLVGAGYVVVSGMARGIDGAAHAAALDAGGGTVGVLGNGIDQVYPSENRALFGRMRTEGVLITEFPPGERPRPGNFPRRNRLIAGLSRGVLVVEMGERSGALHTVNYALEQGKEVFAVPGPIGTSTSTGTNQLLKEGARLVTSVRDVLDEIDGIAPRDEIPIALPQSPPATPDDLGADESRVWDRLSPSPRHVDELAADTGLATSALLTALLGLELRGVVESLPGRRFRRT